MNTVQIATFVYFIVLTTLSVMTVVYQCHAGIVAILVMIAIAAVIDSSVHYNNPLSVTTCFGLFIACSVFMFENYTYTALVVIPLVVAYVKIILCRT